MQSPEATTSAILGASHNGWSPSRSVRRGMPSSVEPQLTGTSDASSIAFLESSPSRRQQSGSFVQLRTHGLVSNSPFKAASPSASPLGSPTRRGITSPGKLGIGNISAAAAAAREQAHAHIAAATSASPSRVNLPRSNSGLLTSPSRTSGERSRTHSDAENHLPSSAQPPRKSQGLELLAKSSYVSNSPFRNGGAAASSSSPTRRVEPQTPTEERPVPVDVHERTPQRISTGALSVSPTRRDYADDGATPRPATHSRSGSTSDSPSSRGGLLTSNRLHGPRTMSHGTPGVSEDEAEVRRERRKTVTFDEVLDVQEFDKESSFDVESLRSMESAASLAAASDATPTTDDEMWSGGPALQRNLVVVNGSPNGSSPAFSAASTDEPPLTDDMYSGCSSSDSRDLSSLDEPPSPRGPPIDDHSFDKTFATAASGHLEVDDESFERDGSYADMSGMRRVDSLVDALLSGPILSSPPIPHASNAVPFGKTLLPTIDASLPATGLSLHANEGQNAHVVQDGPMLDPFVLPSTLARQYIEEPIQPSPSFQASIHTRDDSEGEVADGLGAEKRRPLPTLPPVMTASASLLGDLPALPNWSPLMETDKALAAEDAPPVSSSVTPASAVRSPDTARNGSLRGRPHISRDAILSRVAREKKKEAEASAPSAAAEETGAMKHAQSQILPKGTGTAGAPRQSEPVQRVASTGSDTVPSGFGRPSMPPPRVTPTELRSEPAPAPIPATPAMATSPLERLGAEIAAEHAAAASRDLPPPPPPKDQEVTWFERDESTDLDAASLTGSTLAPPCATNAQTSTLNGRLSPWLLGPAPRPVSPAANADAIIARRRSKLGKPAPRRSQSTGDAMTFTANAKADAETAEVLEGIAQESEATSRAAVTHDLQESQKVLDASVQKAVDVGFGNGIEREISRIYKQSDQKYKVNDRGAFTGVAGDKVSHSSQAGDVDSGKAWRRLRRPSDMHEYAKEMREYRANENPRKAAGKVFVFIDSFTPASVLPVPTAPTRFYCILDNGLHVVKTATSALRPQGAGPSKIGQEFELIQHKNLAFSLTLVAQRDVHLAEPVVSVPESPKKASPGLARGVRGLFGSPRKVRPASPSKPVPQREALLSFLNAQGAFGRSTVVFEPLTQACLVRCHVVEIPVTGVPDESAGAHSRNGGALTSVVRGKLRLKLFYLPPMPSVPKDQLPENLTDCIRGMQHAAWHASEPWMEGVLTQLGGDCRSWRRRPVKAQGAHLIGYNEITKKPTIKIDLSKAISVDESWDPVSKQAVNCTPSTLASSNATSVQDEEELDEVYHVERSFRLTFADGERISFFADTDEQKAAWMACFSKIIGSEVPPNPMWAQVALEAIKTSQQQQAQPQTQPQRSLSKKQLPAVATVREETSSAMNTPERPQSSRVAPATAAPATRVRQAISFQPVTASQTRH